MIEVSIDQADLRKWFVCEQSQRWIRAVRRFSPDLMPAPLVPSITAADLAATIDRSEGVARSKKDCLVGIYR